IYSAPWFVMPRGGGASSTPRPLDPDAGVQHEGSVVTGSPACAGDDEQCLVADTQSVSWRLPAEIENPRLLRRVRPQTILVWLGAPAGRVGHDEVTVLDRRHHGEPFVVPCQPVDVGFHDALVGHGGAEVRVHHGAQMALVIT